MEESLSFKNINKLAIPALISGVSEPLLSLTDVAIVGNLKEHATESLAAVGIVTTFLSMLIWVLGQTRSALSSIVSQYLGANKLDEIQNLPAQTAYIITAIGVFIVFLTYPLAEIIFKFYNASHLILEYCVDYYRIRVFGFPFTLFTISIFGTFRGLQNTYYPMIVAIAGMVVNVVLDFLFVFGWDEFIPAMGVQGAALASVLAQMIMAVLAAFLLLRKTDISLRLRLPLHKELKHFFEMVANLFIRTLALNVTLYLGTSFATAYGETFIAAYTIAINIWFLGAFLIDGYSSAGNILAGKFYGAKQYKLLLDLGQILMRYGFVFGILMLVIGLILYKPIGLLFTDEPKVLTQFYSIFWIILVMQPLCSLAFIYDGIFKGLGKTKELRNLLMVATFVVYVPVLFLLDHFGVQLKAIFIAMTFWIIARSFPLIYWFRKEFGEKT
ncbi:MATE family efflux transporter [Flavobacterium sp. U410]|jgi:putative MATE family efflux protein